MMNPGCSRAYVAILLLFLSTKLLNAQDATVVGTALDESSGVLPGVTVTATSLETGRVFGDVTSDRGTYRLVGVTPGVYKIQAELQGFTTVIVPSAELLVGQNAAIDFTMKVAALTETLTVTGETPLVDLSQAQVAGNVDRRQMAELPIQGRNWMELSMMVKGITANSVTFRPGVGRDSQFNLHLDGQEISQQVSGSNFGQTTFSREAIAEYQIVTNMFDITMGRSNGISVQAISRAGTNGVDGTLYGYIRDDRLNSADFVTGTVLPYSNRQIGGTLGGPILRDKLHYFGSYEYEREPDTAVIAPEALTGQRLELANLTTQHSVLGRIDYQITAKDHVTARSTYHERVQPFDWTTGSRYPSLSRHWVRDSSGTTVNWARVISNSLLQEVKIGYMHYRWLGVPSEGIPLTPDYSFPGFRIGTRWDNGETLGQDGPSFRYDLVWHKDTHDFKIGGEFIRQRDTGWFKAREFGQYTFSALPPDVARRFPLDAWNDPTRWDLSGLDPLVLRFEQWYARDGDWSFDIPRPTYALWIGDTWKVSNELTLNLGLRYDLAWGDLATPGVSETDLIINNGKFTENVGYRSDIRDLNNIAPRVGFTWNVGSGNDLVIRGGAGLYYGTTTSTQALEQQLYNGQRVIPNSYANDGRPGFLRDPTRGVTAAQVLSGAAALAPGNPVGIAHDFVFPSTWQGMVGFQKQINDVMSFDSDLVYWKASHEDTQRDPNLFFDPVTGFNKHPNQAGRPNPNFGAILLRESKGRSDYMAIASSFTRRYRSNFQLGATYTLMLFKHDNAVGGYAYGGTSTNPFDRELDWGRASDFQRHTVRANGIWNLPWDFTIAGLYRLGSGNYTSISSGVNPLGAGLSNRLRRDLTYIPRNSFKLDPVQAFDLRVTKAFRLAGDVRVEGIVEAFNLFNYASYGYNTLETSSLFGRRINSAARPRSGQVAVRVSF